MPEIRYTEQFIEEAASVRLPFERKRLKGRIELLADFPEMGSSNLPLLVTGQYGDNVRKLVVSPFMVLYEIDEEQDAVNVLVLIHQSAAW